MTVRHHPEKGHRVDIIEVKRKLKASQQDLNPHRDKPKGDAEIQRVKNIHHSQIDLGG